MGILRSCRRLAAICALALLASLNPFGSTASETPYKWELLDPWPRERYIHASAFDDDRGKLVVLGGWGAEEKPKTWEWDGVSWVAITSATSPTPALAGTMVYDRKLKKSVLFGGYQSWPKLSNETWTWDGSTWTQLAPRTVPPERYGHAMTYDSRRGRIVMSGGWQLYGCNSEWCSVRTLGDTWEWDGSDWTKMADGKYWSWHSLVYDPSTEQTLKFGGDGFWSGTNDLWGWDGTSWSRVSSDGSWPDGRSQHAAAYDPIRQRMVLFSGYLDCCGDGWTWEWDGGRWYVCGPLDSDNACGSNFLCQYNVGDACRAAGLQYPLDRYGHTMAFNSKTEKTLMFGGCSPALRGCAADLWEWDGQQWKELPSPYLPVRRHSTGMTFDSVRGTAVMFGGRSGDQALSDTWEWNNGWVRKDPPAPRNFTVTFNSRFTIGSLGIPPARYEHSLVFDSSRGESVMFGGCCDRLGMPFGDLWEWNGYRWILRSGTEGPLERPIARSNHAAVFDPLTNRTIIFGGTSSLKMNDMWGWDGSRWTEVPSEVLPSPRANHAMAFNPTSSSIVLFGGIGESGILSDTWEWNGQVWSMRATTGPSAREGHVLFYDSKLSKVILVGGKDAVGERDDVWAWDGSQWTEVGFTQADGRSEAVAAHNGHSLLHFGGCCDQLGSSFGDSWRGLSAG